MIRDRLAVVAGTVGLATLLCIGMVWVIVIWAARWLEWGAVRP